MSRVFALSLCCFLAIGLVPVAHAEDVEKHEPQPACAVGVPAEPEDLHEQISYTNSFREAHRLASGYGVTVALIDTGVADHPRLGGVIDGGDLLGQPAREDYPGALIDCDAHGTIVAGLIAARESWDGLIGVAPQARILSIRQTSRYSALGDLDGVTEAIHRAIDQGADVINASVAACIPPDGPPYSTVELDSALAHAEEAGTVVVAAVGNVDDTCPQGSLTLPALSPNVITVAAVTPEGRLTDYSIAPRRPAIGAPGLVRAGLSHSDSGLVGGILGPWGFHPFDGTSFAAPVVSGVAALLKERHPQASAQEIRDMIYASVDPATGVISPVAAVSMLPPSAPELEPEPEHSIEQAAQESPVAPERSRLPLGLAALVLFLILTVGAALRQPG